MLAGTRGDIKVGADSPTHGESRWTIILQPISFGSVRSLVGWGPNDERGTIRTLAVLLVLPVQHDVLLMWRYRGLLVRNGIAARNQQRIGVGPAPDRHSHALDCEDGPSTAIAGTANWPWHTAKTRGSGQQQGLPLSVWEVSWFRAAGIGCSRRCGVGAVPEAGATGATTTNGLLFGKLMRWAWQTEAAQSPHLVVDQGAVICYRPSGASDTLGECEGPCRDHDDGWKAGDVDESGLASAAGPIHWHRIPVRGTTASRQEAPPSQSPHAGRHRQAQVGSQAGSDRPTGDAADWIDLDLQVRATNGEEVAARGESGRAIGQYLERQGRHRRRSDHSTSAKPERPSSATAAANLVSFVSRLHSPAQTEPPASLAVPLVLPPLRAPAAACTRRCARLASCILSCVSCPLASVSSSSPPARQLPPDLPGSPALSRSLSICIVVCLRRCTRASKRLSTPPHPSPPHGPPRCAPLAHLASPTPTSQGGTHTS
ncbi:hypothetical protein TOPH_07826 [Tolypocladium ophioglossoides CBS 100239]|uniref:Uncharacterized protein n=1 Tax=Tolypocladium ophioglossoides (strain CBS 100239) TaxID=1163406 RepID=A0A0L0N087_TOLOC|nr:hypothetical protein TOPH_07826 [Tolypocladium ophioglossoides CBS 100239]